MTKNEKYWKARTAQRMWEHMQSAEETADQVAKVYAKASLYLSREMQDIFKKYVEKHHLTEKEALQLLNTLRDRTSIEELRQRLQSSSQKQEIADLLAELEAPAYQARIQRLQELQTQIDLVMQQVYKQEQAITTAHYIQLAEKAYNQSIFDVQQRTGFGFSFSHIDQKQVDKVLKSKWSGMNYSERVWRNTRAVAQEVKEALLVNLITGRTERETAEMLTKKFAGGSSKARRLIRTESCYLSNQLEMESYKECGIDKYQYLATLDLRTSEICRELDGKVFLVKDQQPGKNCPPMHPWCRSTTIAIIGEKMLEGMKRRARDSVTGKTYLVPASMNYREWYAKYVKSDGKTVAKEAGSDIIISGARITDIFSEEAEEFAEMYYEEIRSFSTDAKKIANNLNKAESDIRKIKAYLFEDDSYFDSDTGKHRRFDPDCAIAQSWQRLMIGKDIKPHDKTLIEHELLEMKIKEENPTTEHWKAHEMAAKAYDYPKEADEYYGNLKKHNKNKK